MKGLRDPWEIDGNKYGRVDKQADGRTNGLTKSDYDKVPRRVNIRDSKLAGCMYACNAKRAVCRTDGQTDGRTESRTDIRMDRRTDSRADGQTTCRRKGREDKQMN